MRDGFPENKWALGLAGFTFALTVCGRVVLAGCAGAGIGENDQTDGDHQGAHQQSYGQVAFHVAFVLGRRYTIFCYRGSKN